MPRIETRVDSKRGCGWRQPGGLYLVSEGLAMPCFRLPIPLDRCPTCDCGIKPSRGWTWIQSEPFTREPCRPPEGTDLRCTPHCPLSYDRGRVGLLWIGEKFYETPEQFEAEADRLGVSRRIPDLPKGFIPGQTWVWLAHRKAVRTPCQVCADRIIKCLRCKGLGWLGSPGVFRAFKPRAVEYVTRGDETPEQLEKLIDRGITPVKVVREESTQSNLNLESSEI